MVSSLAILRPFYEKGETLHALNPNQPDTACIAVGILVPRELFW